MDQLPGANHGEKAWASELATVAQSGVVPCYSMLGGAG